MSFSSVFNWLVPQTHSSFARHVVVRWENDHPLQFVLITKHQPLNVNILHILISMKQTTHPIRHHASADAYEFHLFGRWRNAQYARGMVWRAVNIPEPQSASGKDDQISWKMRRVVRFPFSLPKKRVNQ